MTWYAAHVAGHGHHELIGTLSVTDDAELRERMFTILHGTERLLTAMFDVDAPVNSTTQMHRVFVKLQEVWSEREVLFRYVTVEDADRPHLLDPRLRWFGATFVPLGAPLMCEWCPDRKDR